MLQQFSLIILVNADRFSSAGNKTTESGDDSLSAGFSDKLDTYNTPLRPGKNYIGVHQYAASTRSVD